jgi:hypothetical protein
VAHAAQAPHRARELEPLAELGPREDVVEAELHDELVALDGHGAGDEGLGVDGAPVLVGGGLAEGGVRDVRGRVDAREEARALQVGLDDREDLGRDAARAALVGEGHDGHGQGLDDALGHVDDEAVLGGGGRGQRHEEREAEADGGHGNLSGGAAGGGSGGVGDRWSVIIGRSGSGR